MSWSSTCKSVCSLIHKFINVQFNVKKCLYFYPTWNVVLLLFNVQMLLMLTTHKRENELEKERENT